MKYILIFFLACGPLMSSAQDCKYDKDELDKFQKIRKIEKTVKVVKTFYRGDGYVDLELCKYGERFFLRFYTASGNTTMVTGPSDALIFLLDDESIVKAFPEKIESSRYNGSRFLYTGTYFLEQSSTLNTLSTHNVKSIRLYYNSVYKDFTVKGTFAKDLMNAIKCFQ